MQIDKKDLLEVIESFDRLLKRLNKSSDFHYGVWKDNEICKLTNTSRLKVYRVRIAPRTVSIEVGIEDKKEGELSDEEIKELITKVNKGQKFLLNGDKLKITVMFRGRELGRTDLGMALLNKVVEILAQVSTVDQEPSIEGRRLSVVLSPKAGV